ncbi:Late embryogenesis abundant protein [Trema orientale]|uniref:Late embryogenesis abundant protein n=2 Tax=Trema orientale TaxID=63057 RepID=A0A2P5ESU1_TREOI|nr:Late embryogenesis abundant protein [Trema orientale]
MQKKDQNSTAAENDRRTALKARRRRCLIAVGATIIVLIMVLFVVILVLALTVFKPKEPKTELLSAAVNGVSPRLSFPVIRIELNVTLDLKILVRNRNYASFRHGGGKSVLLYREHQVGEADFFPGNIPARGSATLPCRLTIEVDELGSDLGGLISDVLAGELAMETRTRIPGRVTFLGFIKKHVVAVSVCQFTVGLTDLKVRSQVCKSKTEK